METVAERIWNLPDAVLVISQDSPVEAIMAAMGVSDAFDAMAEMSEGSGVVAYDDHPTHWIVIQKHVGHSDPNENGLCFTAIPKTACSRHKFEIDTRRILSEIGIPVRSGELFESLPNSPAARVSASTNPGLSLTLDPAIIHQLSKAKSLNDAAKIWIENSEELAEYLFVISSPGQSNFHWPASVDLEGGGYLRSIFAHDKLSFASDSIFSEMACGRTVQIPVDYSIGFDINIAQYLRRLVEGKNSDLISRFRRSLQRLARARFNWDVFPFLQERAEDIVAGRDLDDIWKVVYATERFAQSDMGHFAKAGELAGDVSDSEVVSRTQTLLSDWHRILTTGEIENIRKSHLLLNVLILKVAVLYRRRPSPRDAGRNLAEFIDFMCATVGVNIPWMMWAASTLFRNGGRTLVLRKITERSGAVTAKCRNIAWDFMHYFYRRQNARNSGQSGAFLIPYTLTFDAGLAALFSGFGQRSCLVREAETMGQFFPEFDPFTEVQEKYLDCPALLASFDKNFTLDAHLRRSARIQSNLEPDRRYLLDELTRECEKLP